MKRFHAFAAWLAVVALLLDGLLPTAVAAAARPGATASLPLCSAAVGGAPGKQAPALPARQCALCAGCVVGLLPGGHDAGLATRLFGEIAASASPSATALRGHADYPAAQPRAPPRAG